MGKVGAQKFGNTELRKYTEVLERKKVTNGLPVPFIGYFLLLSLCRRTEYTYCDIITDVDGVSGKNFLQERNVIKFNLKIRDTKWIILEIIYN